MQRARSRWRAYAAAGAIAAACGITAGCAGGGAPESASPARPASTDSPAGAAAPHVTSAASPVGGQTAAHPGGAPTTASPASACVTQVLGSLTLAQRVGQLFVVGVVGNIAGPRLTAAEHTYHFGSLLLSKTGVGTVALAAQTAAMQELALSDTGGVRFFIAANQEGGQIQQLSGPGFAAMPSALVQGSWPLSTLRSAAANWGTDLRAAGVNLDLAPVMDVVPRGTAAGNAPIGALDREFGFDPAINGEHGAAFIQGMTAAGVVTMAKHFPGLGRVAGNTDFTSNVVDNVTTANDPYLNSFRDAVGAGVPMVMVALATYTKIDPKQLAVFSPAVMRLLRNGLGFNGVIVSDDLGQAAAVQAIPAANRAVGFLTAGGDLITSQSLAPAEQMAAGVLAKASGSAAFRATVDAAARTVLTAKKAAGLLPC
ncbi:MAG TPA: glycoside hydrolase family 3 N-terminal domain-containing protein [Trebonia sp.]